MSEEMMTKAALHKRLARSPSSERIELVLDVLGATPAKLQDLADGLSKEALTRPLGEGERSFKRDLTHLIYCAERGAIPIYYALTAEQPFMPRIHAERQWGKLLRYEAFDMPDLFTYFSFNRRALLNVLNGLTPRQWERAVRPEGKKRKESVYYTARGLCVHEYGHLEDLAKKLDAVIR
ncbi:MAG: DinB family protein [Chloroflexi bacterium]|nr:DinB family protein [Chloroflexota bacterium]